MSSIVAVLPFKNEMGHMADVVSSIPGEVEVICVDNNSTDTTPEALDELRQSRPNLSLLKDSREEGGVGYGYAYQTGMNHAEADFIVCMDADGTYPADIIVELVDYMKRESIDMVSCNRYPVQKGSVYSGHARIGTWLLGRLGRLTHSVHIKDIVSGMWVIRQDAYSRMNLREGGWDFSLEVKLAAATNPNLAFEEYSIRQRHRFGASKQNYLKTGMAHAKWLIRHRLSRASLAK